MKCFIENQFSSYCSIAYCYQNFLVHKFKIKIFLTCQHHFTPPGGKKMLLIKLAFPPEIRGESRKNCTSLMGRKMQTIKLFCCSDLTVVPISSDPRVILDVI